MSLAVNVRFLIAAAASLFLATPGVAQSGSSWAVGDAAVETITFSGAPPRPPQFDRSPEEMVRLFKSACIDTGGTEAGIDAAVAAGRLPLVGSTFTAAATRRVPAYTVRLWSGPGVVVARTDGFSSVEAQCNATFHPVKGPGNLALTEAMTAMLAAQPANSAEATKKNGKRKKRFSPRWVIAGTSGRSLVVTAVAMRADRFTLTDHVLIAVRPDPALR